MVKLLLFLNKYFKKREHPFNMGGSEKLNYANFEYDTAKGMFDVFSEILNISTKELLTGKTVLDLGCGAGGKSIFISEHDTKQVIGVDLSQILINQAKEFVKKKNINSDISFIKGDIQELPFENNTFDLLVANDLMEHVSDPRKMLEESFRVLKNGGSLLINFEPYYHFLGHHMWDVINIPWAHLFFSEETRIKAYKELVKAFPDGNDRVEFRISKDDKGKEYIGYLNHITYREFLKYVRQFDFKIDSLKIIPIDKFPLNKLYKTPFIQEFCMSKIICSLQKR